VNVVQQYLEHPTGPVEYIIAGEGPPVLNIHGTGVSNEVVLQIEHRMVDEGFQLIIPHRPGYYGTPLKGRRSPQAAADLYAALLDKLGHEQVLMVGTSGGGPSSLSFVQTYPERVKALVLQCPATHFWADPQWMPAPDRWAFPLLRRHWFRHLMFPVYRYLSRKNGSDRERWLTRLAGDRYQEVKDNPHTLELADLLRQASLDSLQHPYGMQNDVDVFCRAPWTEPEKIQCPLVLLHDPLDTFVPFAHSKWLSEQVPQAELQELHCAGHLLWSGPDKDRFGDLRRDFLKQYI